LGVSWLGVVCYALQIYFDFSGYSDMAIGLGRLFGFRFPENFDHPYSSRSITEFWRRWHISLSSWFRDYLYIPLGGNRLSPARTYLNLVTVFLLCGLWHGASWTFVLWGALHGSFLVLERAGLGKRLANAPGFLQRGYALLVVLVGWVFFRADSLGQALLFLKAMVGGSGLSTSGYPVALYATPAVLLAGLLGVFFSFPVPAPAARMFDTRQPERLPAWSTRSLALVLTLVLFGLSAASLASHTYNPFIYFRF
jgi:alginate O-acetyltransferase complex protein AlgI